MFTSCSWKVGGIPFCIVAVKLMSMISVAAAMNFISGSKLAGNLPIATGGSEIHEIGQAQSLDIGRP